MIDVKKISIVLPEGVTKQGEISLKGNEAELTVIGTTVGPKLISASYDGGAKKTTTLTVTEVTQFTAVRTEPADSVYCSEQVKLIAEFSRAPKLEEVKVTAPPSFVQVEAPKVVGHNVEATYTAAGTPQLNSEFSVNFRSGTVEKTVQINVEEKPALLESVDASKKTARVTDETTVTFTFDKEPVLDQMDIRPSSGLSVKTPAAVAGRTITVTYTCNTAGSQTVTGTYNKVSKTQNIEVVKDAVVKTATAKPESVEVGGSSVITVEYDKEFVTGQAALVVEPGEGVAVKTPYAENLAKNGGTVEVVVSAEGDKTVTLRLGGEEKVVTITGTPKPQVVNLAVEPEIVEKDTPAKVKVTMQ